MQSKNKLFQHIARTCLILVFGGVIMGAMIFSGCSDSNQDNIGSSSVDLGSTETLTHDKTPDNEKTGVTRYWLQWEGSSIPRPGSNKVCAWNWLKAKSANVNLMHVHYVAQYDDGTYIMGLPDSEHFLKCAKEMQYELTQSHDAGIKVIGYQDTVLFLEETATRMGYSKEQLGVRDGRGNLIYNTAWTNPGCWVACINSPEWKAWQTEIVRITAEVGFDGLQYDLHPYSSGGMTCQCDHCKTSWAAYSKEKLGKEINLPVGHKRDYTSAEDIAFLNWRMECFAKFMQETAVEAKKINPDFCMIMNDNVNGYIHPLESLFGGWDMPSSEYWSSDNGYSSNLYMFQLTEALGHTDLYAIYNTADFTTPIWRGKVNFAESCATIGGSTYFETSDSSTKNCNKFIAEHEEMFEDSVLSVAKAAIMYSPYSNLATVPRMVISSGAELYDFATDSSRRAAAALVKAGVCYDYLVLEREGVLNRMAQYDLLVIPEYKYFDESVWSPILKSAVQSQKTVVVIGSKGEEFVKSLGFPADARIRYCSGFNACGSESELLLNDDFLAAVGDTSAAAFVRLTNNLNNTAATIRSDGKNKTYIHIVRRGTDCEKEKNQELEFTVGDAEIVEVSAYCPFEKKSTLVCNWSNENGVLTLKTDNFSIYAIICIETK